MDGSTELIRSTRRTTQKPFLYYLKNSEFKLGFLVNFGGSNGVRIIRRVYGRSD